MYLQTTHIGGLPFYDIKAAVNKSFQFDVPCVPELGLRGDSMFSPLENPGALSCLYEFKKQLGEEQLVEQFEKRLGDEGVYNTVKIQIVGPVTAILSGYKREHYFLQLFNHFSEVVSVLNDGGKKIEIMAFADEPSLCTVDFDFNYRLLHREWIEFVKALGISTTGIHSCGDITDSIELRRFDALFDSEFDIISVDASKYDITNYPAYRSCKRKRMAWGVDFGKNAFGDDLRFKSIGEVTEYLLQYAREGDLLTLPCGRHPKLYSADYVKRDLEMLLTIQSHLANFNRNPTPH